MSAANKQRGAAFELDLVKYFRGAGLDTERLRLAGRLDEGDLVTKNGGLVFIYEAKNVKTINLTSFVNQARVEAENYARARGLIDVPHWAAIVKKRNAPISEAFVVTSLSEHLSQLGIPF